MLIALHGFLGLPTDWSMLDNSVASVETINLWSQLRVVDPLSKDTLSDWKRSFLERCKLLSERHGGAKPWILGYSLGGRLAMEAVLEAPESFAGAIFVSAHPGLTSEEEKAARLEADRTWAFRFLMEPWDGLIADWNQQGVLFRASGSKGEDKYFARKEDDFDRECLARALSEWSLGLQADLRPKLAKLELPVLFMCGREDSKFSEILASLTLNAHQRLEIFDNAGHRLPWDQPQQFIATLRAFIGQ